MYLKAHSQAMGTTPCGGNRREVSSSFSVNDGDWLRRREEAGLESIRGGA
jgi:hypothetical protein